MKHTCHFKDRSPIVGPEHTDANPNFALITCQTRLEQKETGSTATRTRIFQTPLRPQFAKPPLLFSKTAPRLEAECADHLHHGTSRDSDWRRALHSRIFTLTIGIDGLWEESQFGLGWGAERRGGLRCQTGLVRGLGVMPYFVVSVAFSWYEILEADTQCKVPFISGIIFYHGSAR